MLDFINLIPLRIVQNNGLFNLIRKPP